MTSVRRSRIFRRVLILVIATVSAYALSQSGSYVLAYRTTKTVHVFPQDVVSNGWEGDRQALSQELSSKASLDAFSSANAAWIAIGTPTSIPTAEPTIPTVSDDMASSTVSETEDVPDAEPDSSLETESDSADDPDETSPSETIPDVSTETNTEQVPTEPSGSSASESALEPDLPLEPAPATEPAPTPDPVAQPESPATPDTSARSGWLNMIFAHFGTTVSAQGLEEASLQIEVPNAGISDVATCSIVGEPCRTLQLTGFDVTGGLRAKEYESARLAFSFAHRSLQDGESKLAVRYYLDGRWRDAGDIFLSGDISNGTNGGYFTSELSGLDGWEDLSDLVVEFEYENSGAAELYLDAAWIDVDYKERAQDLFGPDGLPEDTSGNVSEELAARDVGVTTLSLADGTHIGFAFTDDDADESLILKTDRGSYDGRITVDGIERGRDTVYVAMTNTGESDSVSVHVSLPAGTTLVEAYQYLKNVPMQEVTEVRENVSYFCEAGWEKKGNKHECAETGAREACSWLNESGDNCLVENVFAGSEESTVYTSDWILRSSMNIAPEGATTTEYVLADPLAILPGQTIFLKLVVESLSVGVQQFAITAEGSALFGSLDSRFLADPDASPHAKLAKKDPSKEKVNKRISHRTEFDGDELPEFRFRFTSQKTLFARFSEILFGAGEEFTAIATIERAKDGKQDIPVRVEHEGNGEWTVTFERKPRSFKPGLYTLELTMSEAGSTFTDSVEFYWGVLAVNPNKSIFDPGDEAQLSMAVLDDVGNTICDARTDLVITDPLGISQTVPVEPSPECGPNNVIEVPDYTARYQTGAQGKYTILFSHIDDNGIAFHRVTDSFEVRESQPFSVERVGPTRIYPKAPYMMEVRVSAREDFSGTIREPMPEGFIVLEKDGGDVKEYGDTLELYWEASIAAGETKVFRYKFDAPDVSPYTYLVGPLALEREGGNAFLESRTWKIASDALGDYTEKSNAWSPTSGGAWIVKDLSGAPFNVPAGAVAEIAILNSDTADERLGGVRHASSSLNRYFDIHEAEPQGVTAVTMHVQVSATSSIQTYAEDTTNISYVLLGYWTSGYYQERFDQIDPNITAATWGNINLNTYNVGNGQVAEMALMNWDTGAELLAGVRQLGSSLNRQANIHESEGSAGGTQGVNGVAMMVMASTSSATIQGYAQTEGANNASIDYYLLGYWNQNPTGLNYTERFDTLTGPTSNSTWTNESLDSYGVPPTGIAETLYAYTSQTSDSSILIGVRTDASSLSRTQNLHEAEAGGWSIGHAHVKAGADASSTIEFFTEDTANDLYRLLGYWSASNYPTNAPTLYNEPFDNEKTGTSTPTFLFSASDPDGTSDIVYQIQWDDDPTLDDAPLGDRSSDNETGCSPNCFTNATTPADTSPFTEGNQVRFRIQTALVSGTTYYWRVRATDVSGSNIASEWSDVRSFTYVANTDPQQWYQSEDTQFDTGTLSGTETYGSNSVRLVSSAPTDALIAYGEGTVQTPRYRLWNGTSWGSELSASSVGGTIQWVVTKAGTTRNEYLLGTQDASSDVNIQVYNGTTTTWGDLQEVTATISDTSARGFDIAYESVSGRALVVFCDGDADPGYYIWNGFTWSGPTAMNVGSANNCEWIKLASDPTSNEIIMVTRDTGTVYEAQVWDGSAWGNSQTLGSMTDVAHEGIAVEYEESGDQALIVVSNGDTAGFTWSAWDGALAQWSIPAAQTLGDDLEWAHLARDDGSDSLGLCYADEDDDLGSLIWDGSAWATFAAATNEFELTGTTNTRGGGGTVEGRPVTCQFETTSGRDGYLMIPYSDLSNARYTYWNGTSHATEASISTIQDSWTAYSARTGDGIILTAFHDDINGRYDESSWAGASWATASTLENSPSVTAAPFREPVSIVARKYLANSGTITSDPVAFSNVSGQPSWGEAVWETTEPGGTDVKMQIAYGSSCASLIPDVDLPGNSGGFDVSSSPLDLSSISTSTYSQLCLKATLSSTNTSVPTLDSWTLSWERQPYLTQAHYRWYVNTNGLTPTDAWPSGTTDLAEDTAIPTSYAPIPADVLRLRLSILNENVSLSSSALTLKLQYALTSSCSAATNWMEVGAIGSTTAKWRGYDNASPSDGATISSRLLSTTDVSATYEEENDSSANPSSVSANQELEYDWVLQHNASSSEAVCFRVITAAGETLNEYDVYPSLITNAAPGTPTLEKLFDNEQVASTTPWFEFVAEDPESNDLTYQIQIDDTYDFSSAVLDRNSQTNFSEFENIVTPADKDPFTSGQTVRFKPTTALSDGTTYYWRVRAKDRNASAEWSSWSTIQSFTVNSGTTITTWYQTTIYQFATDGFSDTEATSTNDVVLTPPLTVGTTSSTGIDFDGRTTGNAWGQLSWNDTEPVGSTITYRVQYWTGSAWANIPDSALAGNAAGFTTSPISLLSLSPTTYNLIRLQAVHSTSGTTPRLLDWTVTWGEAVEQPTQLALFDNEKAGTTTPTFRFYSDDPQDNDLVYEISISTDNTFSGASTTRSSDLHSGFSNTASSTDSSPFVAGDTIRFQLQQADALTNGTTYWWRVRARDPNGGNVWSTWSDLRSFTIDTSVVVSTWFQTTDEQFDTDSLTDIETYGSDTLRITSISREAFVSYAEGTALVPKYRLWNGSSWGDEQSGLSVSDTIRFVESAAAPTRDEYLIATMGSTGGIKAQVYDGATDTVGDLTSNLTVVSDATQRGFDVAYETSSGDAMVVACYGTEATYSIWNGSTWSATSTITLSVSTNCEWVKLAADPTSDEIIAVFRDATTGATDYEAYIWNGSSWGNNTTFGSQATANNEGIAVEYEESGNQAIVAVSNGLNNNFIYNIWNGGWSGTNTVTTGNDFAGGRLKRDAGTDRLALCYTDIDNDLGFFVWSGSAWDTTLNEFEVGGNNFNGRPVTCEFETEGSRDGYLMIPYSDTIQSEYVYWTGTGAPTAPALLTTVSDSWEMRSTRTGDGNVLVVAYDDANTEYDFTYWDGTSWSTEQVLETTSITTVTPATVPLDIVTRRYPSFTSGTVVSSAIDFDDGSGPKWDYFSWNDTTIGSSDILYQIEYFTSTSSWALIPEADLPGNTVGTSTSPFDLGNLNRTTYNTLRLKANFLCVAGDCPTMADWTLAWSEGITVSGSAQQYDQSSNVTSGTVAIAINGELQAGKSATISGGTWSIPNVTVFTGDVVTVFVTGAADTNEAVGVTVYDGDGDITGIQLYERHISLGSNENPTITNANLSQYDYSASLNNEDLFFDVDAGNDLDACAVSGCDDVELWVKSGTTYRPDSASSGNVTTHDIEVNGTLSMDGNTFSIEGSWDNNGTTTPGTSSVIFTATSTIETIDSTGAASAAFNAVTLGQTSGTATWNLGSALDVNGALTVTYGTLSPGAYPVTLASNLTINTNGVFTKGSATTTFDGTGSSTWTDNTVAKQDLGTVAIDGTSKTIALGAAAKATDLTIGSDDTFTAGSSYALEIGGNFTNNNVFTPQSGTVTFTATDTGNIITPGASSFNNITFNGSGGNWSFIGTGVTASGNFTISNGIVTLPSGTTTVAGNFDASAGTFMHNNGAVLLTASAARVITPGTSSFYDLAFNGSGSWTFGQANATSSRHTTITLGAVTLPSGTHAVGGNFARNGGSFAHNSGTLKFTASSAQTVRLNGTDAYNLSFAGVGGSWSFVDTNATTTNSVRFDGGTATLPPGIFAVGGSWTVTNGAFSHNSGIVRFNSGDTGEIITPGSSVFSQLLFAGPTGGWTISGNATSTASTTIASASSFTLTSGATLEVGGTFTNVVGGASTTWSGSTLYLNSGTAYSANTKTAGGDVYDTLRIGANTDVKMWNASSTNAVVASNGSLYVQDHGTVDGALYIWGEYVSNGNEHWSYATDFDGTALGGSSREATVRVANGSSISHGASALSVVGTSTATTTIAVQGSGSFSMTVSGGAVTAQYYAIKDLSSSGLVFTGVPTISSLSNGRFELTQNGGSAITLGPTVVDANTALEIQQVEFATTSAISGTNVHATGTPSSYWWFRNHYGNLDGEQFDNDPTGDPGNVRWDDSGFTITIAGRVFANDRTTAIGNPPCDGSTSVVRVVVNGALPGLAGSCNASTGAYSIPGVSFSGDAVITTYLDTNGGARAVTVSRTPTADILDMNLYQNAVTVRHEGVDALTIDNLAVLDSSDDNDIPYTATSGSPDTLALRSGTELHVYTGKTFAPGGNMTLHANASVNDYDGRLTMGTSSSFVAAGTESHAIGGSLIAENGASITAANSTFTFTATTTGKIIRTIAAQTLYDITFTGAGGSWSWISPATTTVSNAFLMNAGTVTGTSSITIQSGDLTGNGTIAMTGGTVTLEGAGNIGGTSPWTFRNLTLGSGSAATTTSTASATTTITSVLRVAATQVFEAGSAPWVLSGAGTPFVVSGTFDPDAAPFWYTATTSTTIADESYADLYLVPSEAGSPTFTLMGGILSANDIHVGGASGVTVTANTNDPSLDIAGDVLIASGSTLVASNVGAFDVGGSWLNQGTFTHSSGSITFDSADAGESVTPGASTFREVVFDSASGGWTVTGNATTTGDLTLANASAFALAAGATFEVGGTFTNAAGGAATTWTGSTLYLNAGTAFDANAKTVSDTYGTLTIGANTDVRMWNSSAATTTVHASGSLYSQDHADVAGDLYIWGQYVRSSGSDYWSHATDFDGTDLTGSERQVDVRVASSSSLTFSGGVLDIIGSATATTTIAVSGSGRYSFSISGGTLNASYYQIRNTDASGLSISGSPTITSLSRGDYELDIAGGSMLTVDGSVITANPLKIFTYNRFATSTVSGTNVTATGSTASSWKFNLHYGNAAGEAFDSDPAGDPGYIRWDDSATDITIAGNVYSDEGTTVSAACNGSSPVVSLAIQGVLSTTTPCAAGTGAYSIPDVGFNPGDTMTVFLDGAGGRRAANVTIDANTNISDMHLYENRTIVRHEDTSPITIADIALYDSSEDGDIPFTAVDAGSDTFTTAAETKLIVWDSKTFTPGGTVTLSSGGSGNAWDGTLEVRAGGSFVATLTESHSVGGSFVLGVGSTFTAASSTVTFTATTTGKSITPRNSSFYNLVFNGAGGNWSFTSSATSTNDVTITRGTATLPSDVLAVGGSFTNSDAFMHNNGTVVLTSTASGETITASTSPFYSMTLNGSGGQWSFLGGYATTSNDFTILVGSTTLPTTALSVGGSFVNSGGTFNSGLNTVRFTASGSGESVVPRTSTFASVVFKGTGGEWTWATTSATVREDLVILAGSTTLPQGTLTIGGSFVNLDRFAHASGTVLFTATDTGNLVTASTSPFNTVTFNSASGGWTVTGNATTTGDLSLTNASSFTLASGAVLEVRGTFTNGVGGAATTWTGSVLYLNSGTSYSVNAKTIGDLYEVLTIGADTDVRTWNSAATTTTVSASGSLYSQDHRAVDGDLYIWGDYQVLAANDYWSYATDFDGTALGGSSRQVDVRVATSSSVTVTSTGSLEMIGTAAATSTIGIYGSTGTYSWSIPGGTLNASYYQVRNTDASGLSISGSPTIVSLSNGDFELSTDGGAMITVTGAAVDANASMNINNVRFATSTGVSSGYNVARTGTTVNAWNFNLHLGNYDGESFDSDGGDACGAIRWDDSVCLFVSQEHYRWRNDDGGVGAPDSSWYNASWAKRKSIVISNPNATSYTNVPVSIDVLYDNDMQPDFDDLRFTDSSGTTSIAHFTESVLSSASSTVWVEVPSLPASSDTVIYVYYGNGSATDGSDGSGTFSFFDDFEDDNITEYSGDTSLFDVDTQFNYEGSYGLDTGANVDQITTSGIRQTGTLTQQGQTLRFYQYVDSGFDDEPCTLFAVQGAGQNYAVCLDQYPSDQLSLSRDVESNDGSGTELASTTVTWTTGWYEVIIEWLTDDSITVRVYDASGSLFATISDTDATYSSGGIGFSFWGQHGGWDYYTARTYVASDPTYTFGGEQVSGGASWAAAEDTYISGVALDENIRLRFSIQNTGSAIWDQQFRLQYASKGAALNCASVPYVNYNDIPDTTGGCGAAPACMTSSIHFTDQDTMGNLLTAPGGLTFATGTAVEDPSNESASSTIPENGYSEFEYNLELTVNATDPAYCFRVTDGGLDLDNYSVLAEARLVFPPVITGFTLNNDQPITLTEGATTTIYATSTVTDNNGWEDITFATSTIYRSGVSGTAMCSGNENNCYQIGSSGCSLVNCSGTSCTLSCSADIQYFAEATDLVSSFPSETWVSRIYVEDTDGLSDLETATGVELLTLNALGIDTGAIDFGSLEVGSSTGATNQVTGVENTGNSSIDIELSGTDLTAPSSSIAVGEQVYATSTFTYGACAICQVLTGAATSFEVDLPKVTASTSPVTDDIYWGIEVPDGTKALLHQGTNTFIAVTD